MTQQVERLVTMANQIARNFAGWGAEETVVAKTDEHLIKFWTPLMLKQLSDFWQAGGEGLSPVVCQVLASNSNNHAGGGLTP